MFPSGGRSASLSQSRRPSMPRRPCFEARTDGGKGSPSGAGRRDTSLPRDPTESSWWRDCDDSSAGHEGTIDEGGDQSTQYGWES